MVAACELHLQRLSSVLADVLYLCVFALMEQRCECQLVPWRRFLLSVAACAVIAFLLLLCPAPFRVSCGHDFLVRHEPTWSNDGQRRLMEILGARKASEIRAASLGIAEPRLGRLVAYGQAFMETKMNLCTGCLCNLFGRWVFFARRLRSGVPLELSQLVNCVTSWCITLPLSTL